MKKIEPTDPMTHSLELVTENLEQLRALFPEAFVEGKVDFEVLRQLLGGRVEDREEKFGLNWFGKRQARQAALLPSTGTLRPCPEDSVDWDTTQNVLIEGDNLEVLKLLQKSYAGRVKLIYIDPPYNTGKDFVYPDNFQDSIRNYLELTGQVEGGKKISSNTEASGRFHTDWLNMMYPRLKLARTLLRDDGVIFVSIDDNEVANLRMIMDDIFGSENFVATVIWEKADSPRNTARQFSEDHDFLIVYSKSPEWVPSRLPRTEEANSIYNNPDNDPRGEWLPGDPYANKPYSKGKYSVKGPTGRTFSPPPGRFWRISEEKLQELDSDGRIWWGPTNDARPSIKRYLTEVGDLTPRTLWRKEDVGSNRTSKNQMRALFPESESFDTPKPTLLISRMIQLAFSPDEEGIVLDFFAGSGTTAHAVMAQNLSSNLNKRFIIIQLQEPLKERISESIVNISDITKERLRRAGKKITEELQATESTRQGDLFSESEGMKPVPPDLGFRVFKLDATNLREWDPDHRDLERSLLDAVEHVKPGRTEQDLLYEVLLKLGLDLCVPLQKRTIAGLEVSAIGGGTLVTCLAEKISREQIEPLALGIVGWRRELGTAGDPTCVFRDGAFVDDVAKVNLSAILLQHGVTNVRSL
ncbi:MAG: site-specific DNA-methyltransferase [Deltaproteobacteria bacterium HGW-Deltaproteobacteria-22]|jgi:adenine-specific DNA-methyltransferase|nr:MAG: site-specific DNA-methyltransferase [Deltaproteobacteria bacterium HGW-Deltaproteobacteria-22]